MSTDRTELSECTMCGDRIEATVIEWRGREIFRSRACEECATLEEKRRERQNRPTGWIPLEDEIPGDLQDFDHDSMKSRAREKALSVAWQGRRIITGPTGAGKSYLAVAIAMKRIAEGKRPFFTTGRAIKMTLHPTDSDVTKDRNGKLIDRIRVAKWLVIDDVGHGKWSEAYADLFLEIMTWRKEKGKSTILTSQYPPNLWVERFTGGTADIETLKAIVRRLDDHYDHWTL